MTKNILLYLFLCYNNFYIIQTMEQKQKMEQIQPMNKYPSDKYDVIKISQGNIAVSNELINFLDLYQEDDSITTIYLLNLYDEKQLEQALKILRKGLEQLKLDLEQYKNEIKDGEWDKNDEENINQEYEFRKNRYKTCIQLLNLKNKFLQQEETIEIKINKIKTEIREEIITQMNFMFKYKNYFALALELPQYNDNKQKNQIVSTIIKRNEILEKLLKEFPSKDRTDINKKIKKRLKNKDTLFLMFRSKNLEENLILQSHKENFNDNFQMDNATQYLSDLIKFYEDIKDKYLQNFSTIYSFSELHKQFSKNFERNNQQAMGFFCDKFKSVFLMEDSNEFQESISEYYHLFFILYNLHINRYQEIEYFIQEKIFMGQSLDEWNKKKQHLISMSWDPINEISFKEIFHLEILFSNEKISVTFIKYLTECNPYQILNGMETFQEYNTEAKKLYKKSQKMIQILNFFQENHQKLQEKFSYLKKNYSELVCNPSIPDESICNPSEFEDYIGEFQSIEIACLRQGIDFDGDDEFSPPIMNNLTQTADRINEKNFIMSVDQTHQIEQVKLPKGGNEKKTTQKLIQEMDVELIWHGSHVTVKDKATKTVIYQGHCGNSDDEIKKMLRDIKQKENKTIRIRGTQDQEIPQEEVKKEKRIIGQNKKSKNQIFEMCEPSLMEEKQNIIKVKEMIGSKNDKDKKNYKK